MSIKNAIKRLEGKVAKSTETHPITFVIPHSNDIELCNAIKQKLLLDHGVATTDYPVVFVIDFAKAA